MLHPKLIGITSTIFRNFGKEIALTAGLDQIQGDVAVLIDGDFQHPPEMVPEFLRAARRLCEQETDKKATRMAECAIHEYTEFLSVKGAATEQEPGDQ